MTNRHHHNGLDNGSHDPPPSTMAVQLINDLSTTSKLSRQIEQDDLQRLMAEVAELENSATGPESLDVRLEHKHKLIYVFARAVLERLNKDDPFLNAQQLVSQASEALDIFMSAIKETPSVLAYTLKEGDRLQGRGQEALWIWLFPRVLPLLGRQVCEALTEKIKDFFYVSFQAVARSPNLWSLSSSFFLYFKECVTTLLGQLQPPAVISHGSQIFAVLPSRKSEYISFSNVMEIQLDAVSHCAYVIGNATAGVSHATHLISMLVDISLEAAVSYDATPAFQDYVVWLLDSLLLTHEFQKRMGPKPDLREVQWSLQKLSFGALHVLLSSLRKFISPMVLRKGYLILAVLCADLVEGCADLSQESILTTLCSSLLNLAFTCKQYESVRRVVSLQLLPIVKSKLADEETITTLGNDFKKSGTSFCEACETVRGNLVTMSGIETFDSVELQEEFDRLASQRDRSTESVPGDGPPSKRRRIKGGNYVLDEAVSDLYSLLGCQEASDLDRLSQVAESYFAELNDAGRCKAIESLGLIPCAVSSSLAVISEGREHPRSLKCSRCDVSGIPNSQGAPVGQEKRENITNETILTLGKLVKSTAFLDSRRPRVLAMFTLRRFAAHFDIPDFMDLEVSPLGQWCVQSLRSSVRELRIAAGRTLTQFLRERVSLDQVIRKNRFNVLELLHSFSETEPTHLQETCILAWGQVGRILKNDELNLVLLRLVKYLGHSNPVISAVAFSEILKLAKAADIATERLFGAFWDTIAIEVVKDLLVKPQTTQLMADLLGISVSEFLVLTQSYTLPWLVLGKNIDVIKRISEARKDEFDWNACMEASNLVAILALLLQQNVPDMEAFIMSLLKGVSQRFKELDLTVLLRVEPSSQVFYLLKAAGEADNSKKSRIRLALQFVADRAHRVGEGSHKKPNVVGAFLEQHILGLVKRLSEVINDSIDEQYMAEKARCVKAIEELVKIAKGHTRIARPQICASLQSALGQRDLQVYAFSAWQTMLMNLEDDDVEVMLESTFSTVIQRWQGFDESTRGNAQATLQYLLKHRARLVRKMIANLPSLSDIPALANIEAQLKKLRTPIDIGNAFQIFTRRLKNENSGVVAQALVELKAYLQLHQSFLQASAVSEQPDIVVGLLVRSILNTCVKFNESHHTIAQLSAQCIGLIGCLDSNRVESVREQREMVVVSNFADPGETTDFVLFILEEVIVPAFLSTTDTVLQGFFSFVMQELLEKCDFKEVCGPIIRLGDRGSTEPVYLKWKSLPGSVQDTLTPFLSSKYALKGMEKFNYEYPIFRPDSMRTGKLYNTWLRAFVLDLLQKPFNFNANLIYPPLCRAIRIKDISVANFLLPYVVLHVILEGSDQQRKEIGEELLSVLKYQAPTDSQIRRVDIKLCIEAVFRVLDYLFRWIQEKQFKASQSRGQISAEADVARVHSVTGIIPPEIISQRAVECKSYSRALFYWEQHIRHVRKTDQDPATNTSLLERLQDIYTQIDEPDGIEGISAHLHVLDIDQQILAHRKAGRWTAAQSWYEIKLAERPGDVDVQLNLLTCLKESGQHDILLNYVEGMHISTDTVSKLLPFATEASWATDRWIALEKYTAMASMETGEDFNVGIGRALLALKSKKPDLFESTVGSLRDRIARSLTTSNTNSLGASHDAVLKLHVLTELEMIAGTDTKYSVQRPQILESLNRRLEVIGAYLSDKQYVLGIRRAAMQLSSLEFTKGDIASAWLTSARLARKGNAMHQSFNAVLHASQLGDDSAKIEHARLLWKEGHHRKAIQSLQGAIDSNAFISHDRAIEVTSFTGVAPTDHQNLLIARAHLLLAKWSDTAGQTHSSALRTQYQFAARTHASWEKGHYYLGRHYNKLLESEKALAPEQQNETYLSGETAKLVIENYLRALTYGTKYLYQTLPRIITLWLDLGSQVNQPIDTKYGNTRDFVNKITSLRKHHLEQLHVRFSKYTAKMPAYMFYTALPQIVARIAHPNNEVYKYLHNIILKVIVAYPQHALWTLLAVCTSNQVDRKTRGAAILTALRNNKKIEPGGYDIKSLIKSGERLTEQLLMACNAGDFQSNRTTCANLTKDLGINQKICMPSPMTVPIESVLTATLPTLTDNVKSHKAFSRDVVTISSFQEEVLVLSSLQKPRKLTARGSDGKSYGLLCKPKDDLRKDQRLMEFNSMINRSLKRDAESSRRQLYIKTYAVTPLNEECGIIEWVDGLKTLRDILLGLYKAMGIYPTYREIEAWCEEALKSEAKLSFYTEKVLGQFPQVFHKWFVQQFPEPSSWFAARLRYTRSCAVMSMVGTILGLGDRHGENILFEEGNGGTFHVDFNCLFDKGLTFVKPERVPFRLTHNMVDAMGMYGYEGPFRKSSELTLKLLRQHEETLMTILEAFVYDPTLDLLAKKPEKKKKEGAFVVPQTAQGVLDSIRRKVKGLLPGESVPLGVEGQVDELIKQATNLTFLAGMYIGWCSFF